MKIFVKTTNGKFTLCLIVDPNHKILELKQKIHSNVVLEKGESFPVFLLCLEYNSVILEDHQTLKECGIKKNSTLFLRPRYAVKTSISTQKAVSNAGDEEEEEEERVTKQLEQKQKKGSTYLLIF